MPDMSQATAQILAGAALPEMLSPGKAAIRYATTQDIGRIVQMGTRFRNESSYKKFLGGNAERMGQLAEQLISKQGIILSERDGEVTGMLCFVVYPHFMSGEIIAGEVAWWVEPEHRGYGVRLIRRFEQIARERGARYAQMVAPNGQVGSLYERLGYVSPEAMYQKEL